MPATAGVGLDGTTAADRVAGADVIFPLLVALIPSAYALNASASSFVLFGSICNLENSTNFSIASFLPNTLPMPSAIFPTKFPIAVEPILDFAIASPNAKNASAFSLVFLPSMFNLENSTNLSIGVLPPKKLTIPSDRFPKILPIPAAAPPAPNTAKPAPKYPIPFPDSSNFFPSSFSNACMPSASVGKALPTNQVAPAIPAPIAAIEAPNAAAPITTCGLANAFNPPAMPDIKPPIPPPAPAFSATLVIPPNFSMPPATPLGILVNLPFASRARSGPLLLPAPPSKDPAPSAIAPAPPPPSRPLTFLPIAIAPKAAAAATAAAVNAVVATVSKVQPDNNGLVAANSLSNPTAVLRVAVVNSFLAICAGSVPAPVPLPSTAFFMSFCVSFNAPAISLPTVFAENCNIDNDKPRDLASSSSNFAAVPNCCLCF